MFFSIALLLSNVVVEPLLVDDQLVDDEMPCSDVNLFDVYLLFSPSRLMLFLLFSSMMSSMFFTSILFADHVDALDACCISMFDGLLSSFAICISDVDAVAMF